MNARRMAFTGFMIVVLVHLTEHFIQAYQFFALGWSRQMSMGLLGMWFPHLMKGEWLHYGFAIVMLAGLWAFRKGFTGTARKWWMVTFWLQMWHHFEHLILLIQAQTHHFWFGRSVQTSIGQLWFPRLELHLFYNLLIFIPMMVAIYFATQRAGASALVMHKPGPKSGHNLQGGYMPKAKVYTESQMYTGREITVKHGGGLVVGKISNGGQCSEREFAFSAPVSASAPYGIEECVARSAIVKLGK